MMENEVLRVTVQVSDKERAHMGRRMRKYRPRALQRRFRLAAVAAGLGYAALLWAHMHFLGQTAEGIGAVCDMFVPYDGDTDGCFQMTDQALETLRYTSYTLIAALVLVAVYLCWFFGSAWRGNFRSLNGRTFVYEISAQGFSSTEEGWARTVYTWKGVRQVVRDNDVLLVFVDVGVAYFLPLRAFATPEEGGRFFAQAQAWHQAAQNDKTLS